MRGWSLRSPGAREAVHITLSLLANLLFLGGSALLTALAWLGATADVLSGGRVWFLDVAIRWRSARSSVSWASRGSASTRGAGAAGEEARRAERTPLKT